MAAAAAVAVPALGGTVAYAAASGGRHSGAVPAAGGSPSASASPDGPGGRHGIGPWFGLGGAGVHGEAPAGEGDVLYWPRGAWHGFNNSSNADVVLIWGWIGAGSVEASGTESAIRILG